MTAMTCPSREELFDYAVGRLSDEASDSVAEHLESCQSCQAGLATFDDADDTLVARLRLPAEEDPYQAESQCRVAVARARSVGGRGSLPAPEGGRGSLPAPEPEPAPSHSQLLGTLGEYQLLEKLGRGGMGTVYRAVHTKLDRVVALKVLPRSRADDQQAIARFEREMKAIGRLDHPNIVRAHDAREIEGKPVLIMEHVEGLDLGKLVRRLGPLPVADACELARQAALGLEYAHQNGLVHRDVKPSNLMLTPEGEVKILDLGLARFHRAAGDCPDFREAKMGLSPSGTVPTTPEEMTGSGQAMGTADYMAPEQASDSHAVDIRADIYSLGCTLYKLLTGRAPFSGEKYRGSFEKMTAHVQEPVPPIREFDRDIPEELAAVLDRMLAKEPDERYATPAEVAEALAPFCIGCDLPGLLVRAEEAEAAAAEPPSPALPRQGAPGAAEPAPTPLPFWRRGRLLAAAIGLMLLSLGGGIALGIIITIHRHGQTTSVELPEGSNVEVDKAGNLSVTPPGEAGKPALPAAKSDFEAIQGTWEVVSSSQGQQGDDPLLAHGLVTWRESIAPAEVWRSSSVVITKDALKVRGTRFRNVDLQCQIAANRTPKAIDLLGTHKGARGIYELEGDQLKMCLVWIEVDKFGQCRRPDAFSEGLGATNELVVLKRVSDADAMIEADQKAMQGTWEVVKAWAKIPGWADSPRRKYAAPYGEIAEGRKVVIRGSSLTIKGLPGETAKSDRTKGDAAGGVGGKPDGRQPMVADDVFEYELYLHRRIDFVDPVGFPCSGLYRLDGDRLSIRLGELLVKEIEAPPADGEVFLELNRVGAEPTDGRTSTGAEAAPAEVVEVQVDKDGEIRLDGRQVSVDPPAPWLAQLRQRVAGGAGVRVEVRCDPEAAYRHVAALTEALKAAGVKDVSIRVAGPPAAPAPEEEKEAASAPRGILDLRIAPSRGGDGWAVLDEATIKHYVETLQAKGPERALKYCEQAIEQKELSQIVGALEGIESATVELSTLVGPDAQRMTFRPSVSVGVKTVGSKPLDEKLVMQIQTLVAGALAGVKNDRVTVTDLNTRDRFTVDPSTGKLQIQRHMLRPGIFRAEWDQRISRPLAYVPGVSWNLRSGEVEVLVPRTYFELVWQRRNPVPDGQQPRTPPRQELDEIEQDQINRIRRHIAGQLPETEGVTDPSELVTVTVFDDNRSWVTLEEMAKRNARSWLTDAQFGWFEVGNQPAPELITATYEGRQYVLLSRQRAETMRAFDGSRPRNWELKGVRDAKDQQGRPVIELQFNEAGARRLAALSEVFRGNRLAVLVDDKVISAPMLDSKLTDKLQIRGDFDEQEAQGLVRLLQAGMIAAGETTSAQPEKPDESTGQPMEGKGDDQPQTGGAD